MPALTPSHTPLPQLNLAHLPSQPLYGNGENTLGWQLAPAPYALPTHIHNELPRLGEVLWQFQGACEQLYMDSLHGKRNIPAWIAELVNTGKPEALVKFATMKRFKREVPRVLRPDILVTQDGFVISEVDSVPGGLGFTSALNHAYRKSGFNVLEAAQTLPLAWWQAITAGLNHENPTVALVVSDEAHDYHAELHWLANYLATEHGKAIAVVHPKQISLVKNQLVWTEDIGENTPTDRPIDLLYRFFELFDLPNIPNAALMQFAVQKGWVACTPPWKPHLEEKLWLALLHHPVVWPHWCALLGKTDAEWLKTHTPQGWVLDPTPLPPQGVIPGLVLEDIPLQTFTELARASQKNRELVIKPSGFSPLAWGSRGVVIGHDVNSQDWTAALHEALAAFKDSPHVLQRYYKPIKHTAAQLDEATGASKPFEARTRLCPYYLATPDLMKTPQEATLVLGGVLATHCRADKKIIHGMVDAIMAPCG